MIDFKPIIKPNLPINKVRHVVVSPEFNSLALSLEECDDGLVHASQRLKQLAVAGENVQCAAVLPC